MSSPYLDALIRVLKRVVLHSMSARLMYVEGTYLWGVIESRDARKNPGVRICIDRCASVFDLNRSSDVLDFVEPSRISFIDGDVLQEVVDFVRCLDRCMDGMLMKLRNYYIYTAVHPYIVVAEWANKYNEEKVETRLMFAIAPLEDEDLTRYIRRNLR